MKKIIWVIITVLILGLGVGGYGFYGGYKTKNFAKESEKIFNSSQEKWKADDLTNPPGKDNNPEKVKEFFTQVKNDCDSSVNQINSLKATKKSVQLKDELLKYYSTAQKVSENALILIDYMEVMDKISKDMSPTINASGLEQLGLQLTQFKAKVDEHLKTLKELKTTPSVEETNKQMISVMTELSNFLNQVLVQVKNNNPQEITKLMNEFGPKVDKMSKLVKAPDPEEIKRDIISASDERLMNSLANKIPDELTSLKNTIFAF